MAVDWLSRYVLADGAGKLTKELGKYLHWGLRNRLPVFIFLLDIINNLSQVILSLVLVTLGFLDLSGVNFFQLHLNLIEINIIKVIIRNIFRHFVFIFFTISNYHSILREYEIIPLSVKQAKALILLLAGMELLHWNNILDQ